MLNLKTLWFSENCVEFNCDWTISVLKNIGTKNVKIIKFFEKKKIAIASPEIK